MILTSAYGDGVSLALPMLGSPCSYFLIPGLMKRFMDGVLIAEKAFKYAKYSTDFLWFFEPFYSTIMFGVINGLKFSRVGRVILDFNNISYDSNLSLFKLGFLRGAIVGFCYMLVGYLLLEMRALNETGHLAVPFPQLYDGYDGDLLLGLM